MFPRRPADSLSFASSHRLERFSAASSDAGLTDFDPDELLERPLLRPQRRHARRLSFPRSHFKFSCRPRERPFLRPRRSARGFGSKLLGWPAIVILGQLSLQFLAWGFFILVNARGQISLPFGLAVWVKNNGHSVTLLVTLVATVLAGLSSFFFSYAIRRSMALYLYRPVSLGTLGASVAISMGSIIFHRRSWRWPAVSLAFFTLTGVQTSR
ncbi:hypothetical protein DFH06DRAFT_175832 [Mycena polygramma]|nr:hypothetical protein DFH06DRAFT_175832 [Mycena polygramma]